MANANKSRHWVGFDLGGTKMLAVVFDNKLRPLGRERKKTRPYDGPDAGRNRIVAAIRDALEDAGISPQELGGIGVGVPGPVNPEEGVVLQLPNLGWEDIRLKATLEKEFKCPAVIANDVDVGVYGEYVAGAGKKAHCLIGVFPGTGIGGGCVYEGRILQGRQRTCMEIGHCKVMPEGPLCGCGQRGCLEAVASRLAISAAAAAAAYRGDAPNLLVESGTDLANIRSSALARAIDKGDTVVEQIVRNAARWLGVGISNLINLMDPDVIVLGGGLVEAMPKIFKGEVEAVTQDSVMPVYRDTFTVATAQLGDDASITGAAALARDTFGSEKKP